MEAGEAAAEPLEPFLARDFGEAVFTSSSWREGSREGFLFSFFE
jgi:hypothetical protein